MLPEVFHHNGFIYFCFSGLCFAYLVVDIWTCIIYIRERAIREMAPSSLARTIQNPS